MHQIIELGQRMDLIDAAAQFVWKQFGNKDNYKFYEDAMQQSCKTRSDLPRFYLALQGEQIVGSYALLRADLVSRQDLYPWFGCLFVLPEFRGQKLGASLLAHAAAECKKKGYKKLYLCTNLDGYYEKYQWKFLADTYHVDGSKIKVYEKET